jgi:hypothetical protein
MKVYELHLKPHDHFTTYEYDGKYTLMQNEKYPYPHQTVAPGYVSILSEELNIFLYHYIPELIRYGHDVGWKSNWNIIILKKEWKELGIIEVGFFLRAGITDCVNEELTHLAERYLNLKLFW